MSTGQTMMGVMPRLRACGIFAVWAVVGALTWSPPVYAETQHELDLAQMVGMADEIVVGRVEASEAKWQGPLIVTEATVAVEEPIKGEPEPEITVTQLGGTAVHPGIGAPVHMSASGFAALQAGEDVLLFLRRLPSGHRDLVGGGQGRFVLREHPESRKRMVPIGPKGLRVLLKADRRVLLSKELSLDEMVGRIRDHMERGTGNTEGVAK